MASRIFALVAISMLFGCAFAQDPARRVGGDPEIERAIVAHYYRWGAEENFGCPGAEIEAVTAWSVIDPNPEHFVVEVSYYYRDRSRNGRDDAGGGIIAWSPRIICRDFSARIFTLDTTVEPIEVLAMSGPQFDRRGRPWTP